MPHTPRLGLSLAHRINSRLTPQFSASSSADASVCRLALPCRPAPQSTVSWRLKSTNRLLPQFAAAASQLPAAASIVGCRLICRLAPQLSAGASTLGWRLNCPLPTELSAPQLSVCASPPCFLAVCLRLNCRLLPQLSAVASTIGCCLNCRLLPQLSAAASTVSCCLNCWLVPRHGLCRLPLSLIGSLDCVLVTR